VYCQAKALLGIGGCSRAGLYSDHIPTGQIHLVKKEPGGTANIQKALAWLKTFDSTAPLEKTVAAAPSLQPGGLILNGGLKVDIVGGVVEADGLLSGAWVLTQPATLPALYNAESAWQVMEPIGSLEDHPFLL
jgi:hypothetical protein